VRQLRYVYLVVMDAFYTFLADDGWAIASHIALSTLMALFPFLIVLTSLAGFFGSKELADQAVGLMLVVWPKQVAASLSDEIHAVLTSRDAAYPILARTLAARRDNLKETIAALEKWLAGLQVQTEQVAA
jgi:uncharacterized BrkB/YihY/UPF0761 family membrane protein